MDLPDTSLLNFFNKVLISLSDLNREGDSCSVKSLISQCKSIASGGQIGDYDLVIDYCKQCGLIQIKKDSVIISSLGQKFLDANRERFFEINEAQKNIIAERIIFRGSWNQHARELFEFFAPNYKKATYELSVVDSFLSMKQNTTAHFFKYLGILQEDGNLISVTKKYTELVYHLTADSKAISEQQLEKILMENRKLGAQAEIAVVEFEKQRLRKLGKTLHAELVKRISTINTSAGYDIESFDGTTEEFVPNRFIEVKATQSEEFRFYWSNNEMNIAKKKRDVYWIYFMKAFKEDKPQETNPIMIQNPGHSIPKHSFLTMKAHTFIIEEISEVKLRRHNLEELIWYQLV